MIHICAIGGAPGAGKSSLIRALRSQLGAGAALKSGLVEAEVYRAAKTLILGRYDDADCAYPGTDRLSMAVMPQAISFLRWIALSPAYDGWTVLFEGDRLFSNKFFRAMQDSGIPLTICVLTTSDAVLQHRYTLRGSAQSETFLRGRLTKIRHVANAFSVETWTNETRADLTRNTGRLLAALRG